MTRSSADFWNACGPNRVNIESSTPNRFSISREWVGASISSFSVKNLDSDSGEFSSSPKSYALPEIRYLNRLLLG